MAIKEIKREWSPCQLGYVKEFLLHTEDDLKNMPRCSVGSKATVSETDNEYVKTVDGWKLLCDCDEDGGQGAGGSGGAFVVTVVSAYDEAAGGYVETCDKTKDEIKEILMNGGSVTCRYYEDDDGLYFAGILRDASIDYDGNVVLHGLDGVGSDEANGCYRYGFKITDEGVERLGESKFKMNRLYIQYRFYMYSNNGTLWRVEIGDDGNLTTEKA